MFSAWKPLDKFQPLHFEASNALKNGPEQAVTKTYRHMYPNSH